MRPQDLKKFFLTVYDEHADAIYRFCLVRTSDTEVAHDVTQDTFMRFWDTLVKKGEVEYPRALIYQIARNAIIDWYRKHKAESLDELQDQGLELEDGVVGKVEIQVEHAHVLSVLKDISEAHREIITLRFVEGLPPREIAEILGETTNSVSVRINRAIKELQAKLQTESYE